MAKRQVVIIELARSADALVSALSKKEGMSQISLMSHILEWFLAQDESIQSAGVGHYPAEEENVAARLILEKLAGEL